MTVICLLCGKWGHVYASCSVNTFVDNTPIYAGASGWDIVALQSGKALCRAWNAHGAAAACTHDPALCVHLCGFCGSATHYAFKWVCKPAPAPFTANC
jgi:hypothetical protein